MLPPADDVREKVLTLLRDRGGRVEIREIQSALGFVKLDPQNALANPVHAALTALRDAGEIVSHEPTWGDPSFEITPECYSEPNLYQERREAKIDRYEEKASSAHLQAESRFNTAREMADGIPFGQPILVGHHSEKRDRRYRDRIHDNFDKAVKLENKATHYSEKASAAESNCAITSDDPTAVSELRTKLKSRATLQAYMKAINSGIRKAALDTLPKDDVPAKLTEIIASVCPDDGEGKALLQKLLNNAQDSTYGLIFPPHELTNNNAQIRRLKERIAELEKASENETTKTCHGVCTLVEDADENRVRSIFPGKPDELTREIIKSENFRWSRTNGAWQRQLNSAGRVAAKRVLARIKPEEPGEPATEPGKHEKRAPDFIRPDRQIDFEGLPPADWPKAVQGRRTLVVDRLRDDIDGGPHRVTIKPGDAVEAFVSKDTFQIGQVVDIALRTDEVLVCFTPGTDAVRFSKTDIYPAPKRPEQKPATDCISEPLELAEVASTTINSLDELTTLFPLFRPFLGEACSKPPNLQRCRHRCSGANRLREGGLSNRSRCDSSVRAVGLVQPHNSGDK